MTKYSKWPRKVLPVTSLQLDGRNPRIPTNGPAPSQQALLEDLLVHEKVEELAREIVTDGLSPLEVLLGVEEGGKVVVVEGNRRLAALKLLISPELAPEKFIGRFRKLAKQVDLTDISEVAVLLSPSRTDAAPLLIQKHTRSTVEKWDLMMQARFYRALIRDGMKLQALLDRYGSEVSNFLKLAELHDVAKALDLPDDIREAVADDRRFPASGIERLIEMPAVRKQLRLEFKEDGSFVVSGDRGVFTRAYATIISDLIEKTQDTRSLNTVPEATAYVEKVLEGSKSKKAQPQTAPKAVSSSELSKAKQPGPKTAAATPSPKTKRPPRTSTSVVPHGVKCTLQNQRIANIFTELKGLVLIKFPNASGVLLRMLLEMAAGYHLENTGKLDAILAKGRKENKTKEWYPTLRQLLNEMLNQQDPAFKMSPLARRAIDKIMKKDSVISIDSMDQYVHNRFTHPTPDELRAFWAALETVFAVILHEPAAAPPKKTK